MGYSPRALATWVRHTGGVPSHVRRRPGQPHAPPRARRARGRRRGALVPGAGRLPDHALHREGGGHPRLDERRLAHRQPAPRPAGVRPRRWSAGSASTPGSCRRWSQTGSMVGAVRAEVAAELGISPSAQVVTGHAGPALGGPGLRRDRRGPAAHHDQHHLLDLAARSRARRPTRSTRSRPCPGSTRRSYLVAQQPRGGRALPALAARQLHRSASRRLRALIELAETSPPGSGGILFTPWLAGERSPVDDRNARGGWHNLSVRDAQRRPGPLRARGRRLQQPLAGRGRRGLRQAAARPAPHLRRRRDLRPLVPDPRRRHGPHGSSASPSRCTPTSAAPRCFASLGLGAISRDEVARAGAGRPRLRARSGATATPTTASTRSSRASTRRSARCSPGSTVNEANAHAWPVGPEVVDRGYVDAVWRRSASAASWQQPHPDALPLSTLLDGLQDGGGVTPSRTAGASSSASSLSSGWYRGVKTATAEASWSLIPDWAARCRARDHRRSRPAAGQAAAGPGARAGSMSNAETIYGLRSAGAAKLENCGRMGCVPRRMRCASSSSLPWGRRGDIPDGPPASGWDTRSGMRCPSCGNENREGARFCDSCGSRADRASPPRAEPRPEPLPADVPTEIAGRYRVRRFLGQGGRKRVYLSDDTATGTEVAVALFDTEGVGAAIQARARREARGDAQARRPPAGRHRCSTPARRTATPSSSAATCRAATSRACSPRRAAASRCERAVEIAADVTRALEHAHARGDRPSRPEAGERLDRRRRPRPARRLRPRHHRGAAPASAAARWSGPSPTCRPSRRSARPPGPQSDLYSLGALLYEMLTGQPPFPGDDAVSIISQHLHADPVPPSRHNPDGARGARPGRAGACSPSAPRIGPPAPPRRAS